MKKSFIILLLLTQCIIFAQNKKTFSTKNIYESCCWSESDDGDSYYVVDEDIMGDHIYLCINTGNGKLGTHKCTNVIKEKLKNNPFLKINNQVIQLEEIDKIYSCIPMGLWSKKQNNNTYIAIELYTMCYSKYCHDYYYIFVYMEKGVVMNSKIIRSEGTPIDSDTKIKHYMRNGLKY